MGRWTGVVEATRYRCLAGELVGDGPQRRGEEGLRRKPSLVLHWAGSCYAFGRSNPLRGVVKEPSSLDEDL
uniref:Uncharacterized protein n=1 Tax=Oryza glumipatula TaxID=40148 RepID=A0A0E0ARL3_9ORYZ